MIEIKHLKTLQALRNSGSLAGAAAALHQTQSALSHQFSDLEQRLGFRLFVRKSQPLRFTPQGEILLQLANQVLPQIARALQDCNEPQQTRYEDAGYPGGSGRGNAVDLSRAARAPRYLAPLPAAGRHQPAAEKRR